MKFLIYRSWPDGGFIIKKSQSAQGQIAFIFRQACKGDINHDGLALGDGQSAMDETLDATAPNFSADKPRYLMGAGRPGDIIGAVFRRTIGDKAKRKSVDTQPSWTRLRLRQIIWGDRDLPSFVIFNRLSSPPDFSKISQMWSNSLSCAGIFHVLVISGRLVSVVSREWCRSCG